MYIVRSNKHTKGSDIIHKKKITLAVVTSLLLAFLLIHTTSASEIKFSDGKSSDQITKTYQDSKIRVKEISSKSGLTHVKVDVTRAQFKFPYAEDVSFQVWDDSGNMLTPTAQDSNSKAKGNKIVYHLNMSVEEYPKETEYLKIKPVIEKIEFNKEDKSSATVTHEKRSDEEIVSKTVNGDFPVKLDQGKIGYVLITKIEQLPEKTIVHVKADGNNPNHQVNEVWIEDQSGKGYINTSDPKLNYDKNEYTLEFPPVNGPIKVVTARLESPNIYEDLTVKVPLN
ncbi:hypothetical protein [Halobacillus ihumii]|uniref:hypothetical protein n=1 Tax=Halobacillus ihumii TaxID=2686092 RepID=UPI0013D4C9E1|nr:hypothetical protein [Halobacillus ihumii]